MASWRTPPGFLERLADAWPAVLDGAVEQAGGDPARVTRDSFLAVRLHQVSAVAVRRHQQWLKCRSAKLLPWGFSSTHGEEHGL